MLINLKRFCFSGEENYIFINKNKVFYKIYMEENQNKENHKICPWCSQPSDIIWVHGHGQCSVCGYNIDECCRGESCYSSSPTDILIKDMNDSEK